MTGVSYLTYTEVTNINTDINIDTDKEKQNLISLKISKSRPNKKLFFFKSLQKFTYYINHKKKETEKGLKLESNSKNCYVENSNTNTNKNTDYDFIYFPNIIAKSIMAFLAGCILSEKKFFRFGII
jgi:hypothetical protein